MGTLIGMLGLTRAALDADQNAINVTANNVANQNTAGYTRQVVSFSASDSVSLSGFQRGTESVTSTAMSQRDRVLEQRLQQATSTSSSSSSRLSALQDIESAFGLTATDTNASSTALGSSMDSFFSSLAALSANPTDTATRSSVLAAASTLASAFNAAAGAINDETASLNAQVVTAAQSIDGLTSSIATLNQQIMALSPDADAGTLEDQRQVAIQQLSGMLGVNTISNEDNGVTLTTSTGAVLVSGNHSFSVSTTTVDGNTQLVAGDPPAVQSGIEGGSIGGMMQARDVDLPGMLSPLDQLANAVGSAVNTQNEAGLTASGSAGGAIFSLPATVAGSAAGISVAVSDPGAIAAAGASEGAGGTLNAIALSNLAAAPIAAGATASNFFGNFIGALGSTVQSATVQSSADTAATTQAQTQRDSFSAVSLDDEASALSQFQRSYEAAAKLFTIVDEMMSSAINLGVETSVS